MKSLFHSIRNFTTSLFVHEEKRRVMSNFFFLSLLQGANYLLPLLTFPYLSRVLGPGLFGTLAIASSLVAYFNPLVDFGFGFTATREIAVFRENKEKVTEIFSAVMLIKLVFTLVSFLILLGIVSVVPGYRQEFWLFVFTFGLTIGQVLFPTWFFQGMEQMKYVTFLNILAKTLFTLAIFLFVRTQSDYLLVPFFQGMGFIVSGFLSLWIVYRVFGIRWVKPSKNLLKTLLKDSWYLFVSSLISSLYMISAPLLLSFYVPREQVGYFYGAQKIIDIIKTMLNPLSGAFYPFLSHRAHHQREHFPHLIKKLSLIVGGITFVISLTIFIGAEPLVLLVLGNQYQPSIPLLRIMSLIPFFVGISTVWGSQTLLPLKKNRVFTLVIGSSSILCLVLALLLLPFFQLPAMAGVLLFTEALIAIQMFVYLLKTKFFSRSTL
ncbi:MAG: flippase [Brevinematales bacterium]|nr:flippase [Brevinematales bacterium]